MKKLMTLLSVLLMSMTFFCGSAEAGEYKDPIDWKNGGGGPRSIFPISGQVDENIVTVYLYESPGEATVQIQDESGCIIYNNVYTAPSILTIDLNGQESGTYQITVEYEGKVFVGTFEM